jgi:DnaJ like chaperone protein
MAKYSKWLLGGLGWVLFSPIGGLIGFAIGSLIDAEGSSATNQDKTTTKSGDFVVSLLILLAAVLKADGKVLKSELDVVKSFLVKQFGEEKAAQALQLLRDILKQDIQVSEVASQINLHLDYSSKMQLIHLLFAIAIADGIISKEELIVIEQIATNFHINSADYKSIKSMFIEETNWAYEVLEIGKDATDEEIKKAYKEMAKKHHPDKVAYLGDDIKNAANEKFKKINEAYELVKKERKIV